MSDIAKVLIVLAFLVGFFCGNYTSNPDFRESVNEAFKHLWERG